MGEEADSLEVTVARIEERQIAQGARIGRIEGILAAIGLAIGGAIITAIASVL